MMDNQDINDRNNKDASSSLSASDASNASLSEPRINEPSPSLVLSTRSPWLPILESSNQLVLYNPTSHALSVTAPYLLPVPSNHWSHHAETLPDLHSDTDLTYEVDRGRSRSSSLATIPVRNQLSQLSDIHGPEESRTCPWCSRPFTSEFSEIRRDGFSRRAPNYFQLLEQANYEANSRPVSPPPGFLSPVSPGTSLQSTSHIQDSHGRAGSPDTEHASQSGGVLDALSNVRHRLGGGRADSTDSIPGTPKRRFGDSAMAQGYFAAFFKEEKRLGMGANGSVYLCQHILDGNYLGHFAVKKIAVGHSHEYLLRILREVRLLETLRHPNIVSYHHSWLETTRFSSFGPSIPTLHVLMEWAECGSLDDLIDARQGKAHATIGNKNPGDANQSDDEDPTTRSARIRAFKAVKKNHANDVDGQGSRGRSAPLSPGILLLSAEEIKSYLSDIVSGLAFLHDRSILHLDLKLGNVLLTKEDERMIPRAMLSDFGTSRDAIQTPKVRSGNTGTVEYCAPEALARDEGGSLLQVDSKSDMWSLGMILHKLIFFRLPYPEVDPSDVDGIERDVLAYPGWKANAEVVNACKRRGLPRAILILLEGLLTKNPRERPTSERVLSALKEGTLEPHPVRPRRGEAAALTVVRRRSSSPSEEQSNNSTSDNVVSRQMSDPPSFPPDVKNTTRPSSPLLTRMHSPRRSSIPESITALLLPAPVRAYAQTRWRTVRTLLLLLKILSLSNVCHPTYPVMWMQTLTITLAVYDVWQEGGGEDGAGDLRVSAGLVVVHVLILALIRRRRDAFCAI